MKTSSKRFIFFGLIFTFLLYTVAVDTVGTASDAGADLMGEKAQAGKLLYQKYNCTACHQIYGLGGYLGPDLTNVVSAKNKGAAYAKAIIKNGTMRMPNLHIQESEVDELVSYLTYLSKTGISPVKEFEINYDGTVNQTTKK